MEFINLEADRLKKLRGSGQPYVVNVKIVLEKCKFSQELFIVGVIDCNLTLRFSRKSVQCFSRADKPTNGRFLER